MLVRKLFGWSMLYEIVPGFIQALVAIIIVSLFDNEPSKEILQDFKRSLTCEY
jgi:sodium/proline symporter